MILINIIFINLIFIKCENEILEDRSVDEDDPKLFHGYLLKKMMESIPNIIQRWKQFKAKYGLKFSRNDNKFRFFSYAKTAIFIHDFMKDNSSTFTVAENDFSHLTREEYFRMLGYIEPAPHLRSGEILTFSEIEKRQAIPKTIDWREKNAVTPVRAQKNCGSCYAWTVAATLEGAMAIKTGKLVELSKAEIVDCTSRYGNKRCHGGNFHASYKYMMDNSIANETSYPYKDFPGMCRDVPKYAMKLTTFKEIPEGDEDALARAVLTIGPVAIGLDTRYSSFRNYESGIYKDRRCSTYLRDHAVTLVGITDTYYIIKNSWGLTFGIDGYIHIARNAGNICGVASAAVVPIL